MEEDIDSDVNEDDDPLGSLIFHLDIRYRYLNGGIIERRYSWRPKNQSQFDRVFSVISNHPIQYVRTLIQLGYEPLPSFPTRTIFGTKRIGLPNLFSYLNYIVDNDGYLALFKGLTYNVTRLLISDYVVLKSRLISQWFFNSFECTKIKSNDHTIIVSKDDLYVRMIKENLCQIAALSISYPFTVLVTRTFAQFVGNETIYSSLSSAITDIYQNEGFLGFYSGFAPRLIHDVISFWTARYLLTFIPGFKMNPEDTTSLGIVLTTFLLQPFLYPFQLVSSVMAVNSCASLKASRIYPQFKNWRACWTHLQSINHLKRGGSLIWRYQF